MKNTKTGVAVDNGSGLFKSKENIKGKEISKPQMIKARDIPDQSAIEGKFLAIDHHEIEEGKGKQKVKKNIGSVVLELAGGRKVKVGITAMISYGLEITGMEEGEPTSPHIGKFISILKDGMLPSKKGNDAHNFRIFIS